MNFRYGIIILLIICSVLSAIELNFIEERKKLFWKISFYLGIYLFIMSFTKYYLGYHKENLIESFWNVQPITFVHYGIPLAVIAVTVPFLLKILFKEKTDKVIRYFDSALFFTLSFTFFIVRKINNKTYSIAFLMAVVVTGAAVLFKSYWEGAYTSRKDIKKKALEAAPVLLYYLVTVVIYTPNELYLNNAADFPMSYWYFFGKLLLSGVIVAVFLMIGILLYLNQKHMKLYLTLLFAFLTAGYIQGLFLNGRMGVLDGTENNAYDLLKICINLTVWIVIIGAVLIFSFKKQDTAQKFMKVVSIWIILIQIISLGTMLVTSKDTTPKSELALTTEGMNVIGEKNNIIVLVLDKFDRSYMDEITEKSPDFFQPLNDFTFYENAVSAFCPTYNSIPFLLSGTELAEDSDIDYVQYAYEKENLLEDIHDHGYDIGIYTNKRYVAENMMGYISNYEEGVRRVCSMDNLFAMMTQCSRYKMAPFVAKEYYVYDTSDIAQLVENDRIVNIENDIPFYRRLMEEGLQVSQNNTEGTFRFIHMHGGHPPYTMTEDFQYVEYDYRRDDGYGSSGISQRKGAMKIVYEYIRQLKELGKYDESLLIITTDHGLTSALNDSEGNIVETSIPILFVKEPYETHENMVISNAPVCHKDMLATIRKKIGIDNLDKTLSEISCDENRVRYMYNSTPDLLEKYAINGDVGQINNWELLYSMQKKFDSVH